MNPLPKILFFSPSARGGIAEHNFYQARALKKAGAKVICLANNHLVSERSFMSDNTIRFLDTATASFPV